MTNERKPSAIEGQPERVVALVTLSGHELKTALEFLAPDGNAEQLEGDLVIAWKDAGEILDDNGKLGVAGYYAWYADYPDEGCILLTPNAG